MTDLIDEFVGIVRPYCDSPDCFIEAGGYYLMSTLLGRFFRCTQMPQRGKPNTWIILSSIPGRMRRSTIQHYTDYIYKRAMGQFLEEIHVTPNFDDWDPAKGRFVKGGKKEGKKANYSEAEKAEITATYRQQRINDGMIEEGTPEGIMDKIEDSGLRAFTIVSTEIGSVLKRMGARDYQIGVSTLLSKLYYGEGGSISLSRRGGGPGGRTIPDGLYVTMFAGMQEPKWYLDMSMVRQGLLRRIMILHVKPEDLNRWMPPLVDGRDEIYGKLGAYADKMAGLMVEYHKIAGGYSPPFMDVQFHPKVREQVNEQAKVLDDELKRNPTNANIYRQSMWEHTAKLAMLRRMAKGQLESLMNFKQVTVGPGDLVRANEFMVPVMARVEDIILSIGEEPQPIRTFEEPLERVFWLIAGAGPNGIKRQDLYRGSMMKADELDMLVSTLIRGERIVQFDGVSTGGRVPKMYKIIK